jgi:hypothetical protein
MEIDQIIAIQNAALLKEKEKHEKENVAHEVSLYNNAINCSCGFSVVASGMYLLEYHGRELVAATELVVPS